MRKILTGIIICTGMCLSGCVDFYHQEATAMPNSMSSKPSFPTNTANEKSVASSTIPATSLVNGPIDQSIDNQDRLKIDQALENNAIGQSSQWDNSSTNVHYTIALTQNVTVNGNPYCREYRITATHLGTQQKSIETACRQTDGAWQVVSGD